MSKQIIISINFTWTAGGWGAKLAGDFFHEAANKSVWENNRFFTGVRDEREMLEGDL